MERTSAQQHEPHQVKQLLSIHNLKLGISIISGVALILLAIYWIFQIAPFSTRIPYDYSLKANIVSVDNFFDEESNAFTGEIASQTKFSYSVQSVKDNILTIKNIFDVRQQNGEPIFSVTRLYGINADTGEHVSGAGDKNRTGYLFAPKNLQKQDFIYWHINYDTPATMKFQGEEHILGLRVYRYEANYKADQTKDLTHLPEVGKTRGVNLDIKLQLWVEPITGQMVKYQDNTQAFYYDLATGQRIHPWNTFSNTFTESSVSDQVTEIKRLIMRRNFNLFIIPLFLMIGGLSIVVVALLKNREVEGNELAFLPKKRSKVWDAFTYLIPLIFLILSLAFTRLIWRATNETLHRQAQLEFDRRAENIVFLIQSHIENYINALYGARGLFTASETVSRAEWEQYIQGIDLPKNYEGMSALSYYQRVFAADKDAFSNSVIADTSVNPNGYPNFTIYPSAEKTEYTVLTYSSPITPDREKALGLDYSSEAVRNAALERARDTGEPSATAPVIGVITKLPSFSILLPLYQKGLPTSTVQERQTAYRGLLSAGFQIQQLFSTLFRGNHNLEELDLEIYDGKETTQENHLFSSKESYISQDQNQTAKFKSNKVIEVAGRTWLLNFSTNNNLGYGRVEKSLPGFVLFVGVVISFSLSFVLYLLLSSNQRAYHLVRKATRNLQESEEKYRLIFESLSEVVFQTDMQGFVTVVSPSVKELIGISPEEIVGRNSTEFLKDPNNYETFLEKVIREKSVSDYNLTIKNKAGEDIVISISAHLLYDENNIPKGVEGILHDVTKKQIEANELKRRTEELERVNKIMIDRELKMIELKKEVERLSQQHHD